MVRVPLDRRKDVIVDVVVRMLLMVESRVFPSRFLPDSTVPPYLLTSPNLPRPFLETSRRVSSVVLLMLLRLRDPLISVRVGRRVKADGRKDWRLLVVRRVVVRLMGVSVHGKRRRRRRSVVRVVVG